MSITAAQVKELREKTGAGMMDAKSALVSAEGDMEKAAELLRQKGMATAEKKSGRAACEGTVVSIVNADATAGALAEVNCETDFVAKGDAFQAFAKNVVQHILEKAPKSIEELNQQPYFQNPSQSIQDYLTEQIAQIKENMSIRRFVRYALTGSGAVHTYIHTGGKIGVLLEVTAENASVKTSPQFLQLVKDIAMQIASASPEFARRDEISQDIIDEETRVEMGKEDIASKPEDIRKKIVTGRVDKLLAQKVLLEQPFVKNPNQTIDELLKETSNTLGTPVTVSRFSRYLLGEGLEKKESNFAEEVMAAAGL